MKRGKKLIKNKGLINTYRFNNVKNNFLNKHTLYKKKYIDMFGKNLRLLGFHPYSLLSLPKYKIYQQNKIVFVGHNDISYMYNIIMFY